MPWRRSQQDGAKRQAGMPGCGDGAASIFPVGDAPPFVASRFIIPQAWGWMQAALQQQWLSIIMVVLGFLKEVSFDAYHALYR
jgi:hypothetical protein